MSTLKVDNILDTSGNDTVTGKILQVQTTMVLSPSSQSVTGNVLTEVTGVSVSITPSSTSSKILLFGSWNGEMGTSGNEYNHIFAFKRDSTYLGSPVAGNRTVGIGAAGITLSGNVSSTVETSPALQYLDTPSTTSQITYKLAFKGVSTATLYNNRTVADSDAIGYERGISMITAMEIAA
jgi:hypothetical protein